MSTIHRIELDYSSENDALIISAEGTTSNTHADDENFLTKVVKDDAVVWLIKQKSTITSITGIDAVGSTNLFKNQPVEAIDVGFWYGTIGDFPVDAIEKYNIRYTIAGDNQEKIEDPKLQMHQPRPGT